MSFFPKPYFLFFDSQFVRSAATQPPSLPYSEMASLPESQVRGDVLQTEQNLGPDVLVLRRAVAPACRS